MQPQQQPSGRDYAVVPKLTCRKSESDERRDTHQNLKVSRKVRNKGPQLERVGKTSREILLDTRLSTLGRLLRERCLQVSFFLREINHQPFRVVLSLSEMRQHYVGMTQLFVADQGGEIEFVAM